MVLIFLDFEVPRKRTKQGLGAANAVEDIETGGLRGAEIGAIIVDIIVVEEGLDVFEGDGVARKWRQRAVFKWGCGFGSA